MIKLFVILYLFSELCTLDFQMFKDYFSSMLASPEGLKKTKKLFNLPYSIYRRKNNLMILFLTKWKNFLCDLYCHLGLHRTAVMPVPMQVHMHTKEWRHWNFKFKFLLLSPLPLVCTASHTSKNSTLIWWSHKGQSVSCQKYFPLCLCQ